MTTLEMSAAPPELCLVQVAYPRPTVQPWVGVPQMEDPEGRHLLYSETFMVRSGYIPCTTVLNLLPTRN
jgi:hypothetical protein